MPSTPLTIHVDDRSGDVSALLQRPEGARALYVLAHGAGAGMRHAFMESMAERLHDRGVATLRFAFPYTEAGRRRPDPKPWLLATIAAAIAVAQEHAPGLPLFAGGKSMGGRMTSTLAAQRALPLRGLVFLGFPLHPPGRVGIERAAHLAEVESPMLFIQGTRDKLAELGRMTEVVESLRPRAELHVVEDGDHSFAVPKRSGRSPDEVLDGIADVVAEFVQRRARSATSAPPGRP